MTSHHLDEKPAQDWEESIDHATAISLAASYAPGSPEEKKLLRKLDLSALAAFLHTKVSSISKSTLCEVMGKQSQ